MLPAAGLEKGLAGTIDEEQLVVQSGIDDFADSGERHTFDGSRQIQAGDDQFVLFAAVEGVNIGAAGGQRNPVLIYTAGYSGFLKDVCKVSREPVTDVDHRMRPAGNRCADPVPGFRI